MNASHFRSCSLALIAGFTCALFAAGCKDDAGPPEARVAAVTVVSGEGQQATAGTAVGQPLVARAADTQGGVVAGATAAWEVVSGAGSVEAVGAATDAGGLTRANWTLGPGAGEQSVRVTVGTASALFHASAAAGPAASIEVTPATLLLDAIGATGALQAAASDANGNAITGRSAEWTSSAPAIASVNGTGTVTAVAPGDATVRAKLDGASGEATVTVMPQPASIDLAPATAQLTALGQTVQFQPTALDRTGHAVAVTAAELTWTSSDEAVVTVDGSGVATAKGAGGAQVRATKGSAVGVAQVSVVQNADSVKVSPSADTLSTAMPTLQLTVAAFDTNGQPIAAPALTWSSSNAAVATVSATGLVSAVANGVARIRVTSGSASDSATITVRLNRAPSPSADTLATAQDTQLGVPAPGLLANDTTAVPAAPIVSYGGGSLGAAVTAFPAGTTTTFGTGGSIRVGADGSVAFMPSAGFVGTFTFNYRAQNAAGVGDATVSIVVGHAPTAADDAFSTAAGTQLDVGPLGVLANDDRAAPLASLVSFGGGSLAGTATSFVAGQKVGFGVQGFLRVNADGSFSLTPPIGFTGDITFQYRIANGLGTSDATVTITVL